MAKPKDIEARTKEIMEELSRPEKLLYYGKLVAEMIRKRTRLGYGVKDRGEERAKLKDLKPSTIEDRKRAQKRGELSGSTIPGRSNLTRSGQLLDSEDATLVGTSVIVGPTGTRNDPKRKNQKSNLDIARYQHLQGRDFNNLSNSEVNQLKNMIRKDVKTLLEKKFPRGK